MRPLETVGRVASERANARCAGAAKRATISIKNDFDFIAKTDETHTAVRFVTSWATSAENVGLLAAAL